MTFASGAYRYVTSRAAATMSSTCGTARRSRLAAYGNGTSLPVTRLSGASSQSKHSSMTIAAISEPMPANGQPSSTETMRLVFLTEATTVSRSEEHTSELQSQFHLVCRLLLE